MSTRDNTAIAEGNGLPKGWVWSRLGNVSEKPQYGWTTKANHNIGKLRLLRTTDITSGSVDWSSVPFCTDEPENVEKYLIDSGDILISRAGSVGVSFLINKPERAVFASYLIRFRPKKEIDTKYFYYYLKSPAYWKAISASKSGIAVPNVNASKLAKVPIPVAPLDQQKRIVAEIEKQFSRLDKAVASLKRVKANLKRYKAAVLKAAVEGHLVETEDELARREGREYETGAQLLQRILAERRRQWEETELAKMKVKGKLPKNDKWKAKYKEPAAPDTANLPKLPEGWMWASLPQLGELNRGKSKHRPRNDKKLFNGPYPFIQTGDIRKSEGIITKYSQTYSEVGLKQSRLWPVGTLCITIAANIAETGILNFAACFPDSVVGFFVKDRSTTARFVEYFIRTAREKLEQFAPATAQKNINLEVLKTVVIPLPPLGEQHRIVTEIDRCLSILRGTKILVDSNLQRAKRTCQSILQNAFSGRLVLLDVITSPKVESALLMTADTSDVCKQSVRAKPSA
jgi:type I restriction enzyme S subunit